MKIILNQKANSKMKYYVQLTDNEISGMAKSTIDIDKKIIYVTDVMLFEQTCDSSNSSITDESQAKFMNELMVKEDKDIKSWNIWWHSHNDFDVFWSSNDEKTAEENHSFQNYLISIVTNKEGEFKARLDMFADTGKPFNIKLHSNEDLDVEIEEVIDKKLMEECTKDVKQNIIIPTKKETPETFKIPGFENRPPEKDYKWWDKLYGKKIKNKKFINKHIKQDNIDTTFKDDDFDDDGFPIDDFKDGQGIVRY